MWKKTWIILLLVLAIVTWRNYPWGTSLLGWDSVQPEFNFGINLQRALSNVWVENQGVGHIGGHGYATILVQGVIEWVIHLVVGVVQTRAVFIFAMLWLGPIGIYVLWKNWFTHTGKFMEWGALLASLFYLFNLGTVQVFYAPLEAFATMYGLLPWAIWSIVQYWQEPRIKSLVILLLVQIIFSMIGFIPPQFVAYGMVLAALSVGYVLGQRKNWWIAIKRVLMVGLVVVVTNAYWLLPIAYYSVHGASSYVSAKNNQVSTPDFQYMSEARGTWRDVALMRGFFFDSSDSVIKGEGKFFEIFQLWQKHLQGRAEWVGYGLFVVTMIGVLGQFLTKGKRSTGVGLLLVLVIGWMAVAQADEPFRTMANTIHNVPIVGQAFRAAFTKFVCLLILGYSIGFGHGMWLIYKVLREKMWVGILLVGLGVGSLVIFLWPMFNGGLIYERMKINMPSEYGQVMRFFKNQEISSRIAYLPSAWMWGWQVHEWGYSGSGFLWYGIEQPILDRAFDVWSPYNEGFYDEFSNALYGCDESTLGSDPVSSMTRLNISADGRDLLSGSDPGEPGCKEQVARVLEKYDVRYVLLDESVIAPGQDKEILRIEETKRLAEALGWEQKFQEGFLTVWDAESARQHVGTFARDFVSAPGSYTWVGGETTKTRQDVIYQDVGTYLQKSSNEDSPFAGWRTLLGLQPRIPFKESPLIAYPFAQLMREETANVEYGDVGIRITNNELRIGEGQELEIPGWKQGEWVEVGYELRITNNELRLEWKPIYTVNGQEGPRLQSITNNELRITNGAWVQVGENKAVYVKQGEVVQGSAKLQVGEPIHIKIFDGVGKIEKVIVGDEQQCGDYRCWATPLPKAESDSLVQTITHYEGQVSPEICLDKEGDPYACTNELRQGQSPVVVTTAVHKGERYWLDWVAKDAGTTLKEPGVVVYGLDDQWTMDDGQWGTFLQNSKFQITNPRLEVEVPGTARVYDFGTLGKHTIANCDVLKRGRADKLQMSTNKQMYTNVGQETGYTADERGAACDYAEMSQLDTRLPYLMRVVGQNVAGRSLKFFLWNTGSKRNDIEALTRQHVSTSARFDQTFSLLPWEFAGSYTLNTETRSFGQYAENRLAPVEVRYVPLEQLAKSKIQSTKSQTDDVGKIQNNLQITYTKKVGTWLYRIGIQRIADSVQPGQGLIRLSQGFDNGWVGVLVNSNSEFRIQKLEHAKVDGWANGWMVPAVNSKFQIPNSNEAMIIFYWPQLLEYIGFVALGFTLIFLFVQRGKRRDTI